MKTLELIFEGFFIFIPFHICYEHFKKTILDSMKRVAILIVTLFCSLSVFASENETKTFLVIFKSKELKSHKVSLKEIESQFSSVYKTKSYEGNSEPSVMIDIPACDFDECFLGDFLISLGKGEEIKLQEIAFRVIDMTESKKALEQKLLLLSETHKKVSKTEKVNPRP